MASKVIQKAYSGVKGGRSLGVGMSHYFAQEDAATVNCHIDRSSRRIIWTGLLLILLAMTLSVAGIPLSEVHIGEEAELSAAVGQSVYLVAPNDGAILPPIHLLDAYLPIRPAQIEASAASYPNLYRRRPASRAPPVT